MLQGLFAVYGNKYKSCPVVILEAPGVLGSWGESPIIFREQGEIAKILREAGSKPLILGSWGALSKVHKIWLLPPGPPLKEYFRCSS